MNAADMMSGLPVWAAAPAAVLLVIGGVFTLIGSHRIAATA